MRKIGKTFMSGRSQAVRLPLDFRMDSETVTIIKIGDTLIITPENKKPWSKLDLVEQYSQDVQDLERDQPKTSETREEF